MPSGHQPSAIPTKVTLLIVRVTSEHCSPQDSDSGSDGMPRRGSRDSVGAEGIPVPDVSRRHQSANSCGKAERAVPDAMRAGLAEC